MRWYRLGVLFSLLSFCAPVGRLAAQPTPQLYRFEPAESELYVVTHRAGLLSFLGHNHAIVPGQWSGTFCWSPAEPENAGGSVTVDTRSLVIDSDEGRALAGLGGGPSAEDVRTIQQTLLAEENLHADEYPELLLEITDVARADGERLDAEGWLTIRGVTQDVVFPIELIDEAGGLRVGGSFEVRQSDFGIKPESVAGVVRVADPVDIHFSLFAVPASSPCR